MRCILFGSQIEFAKISKTRIKKVQIGKTWFGFYDTHTNPNTSRTIFRVKFWYFLWRACSLASKNVWFPLKSARFTRLTYSQSPFISFYIILPETDRYTDRNWHVGPVLTSLALDKNFFLAQKLTELEHF